MPRTYDKVGYAMPRIDDKIAYAMPRTHDKVGYAMPRIDDNTLCPRTDDRVGYTMSRTYDKVGCDMPHTDDKVGYAIPHTDDKVGYAMPRIDDKVGSVSSGRLGERSLQRSDGGYRRRAVLVCGLSDVTALTRTDRGKEGSWSIQTSTSTKYGYEEIQQLGRLSQRSDGRR